MSKKSKYIVAPSVTGAWQVVSIKTGEQVFTGTKAACDKWVKEN